MKKQKIKETLAGILAVTALFIIILANPSDNSPTFVTDLINAKIVGVFVLLLALFVHNYDKFSNRASE